MVQDAQSQTLQIGVFIGGFGFSSAGRTTEVGDSFRLGGYETSLRLS